MRRGQSRPRDRRGKVRAAIRLGSAALLIAAVVRELRRPKAERRWAGKLGPIPYDLRTPTPQRLLRSVWSPEDPHILVPRAFGVGWSINFAALRRRAARH
ncbi:MAG: DUF5808 domain-containing protein [Acidothermus cellulolyticus]|nr:DUF5808 domain-containing protein [Acidothermus cellulolyticus]